VGGSETPEDRRRVRSADLEARERQVEARERAADERDRRADERERAADRRELEANAREAAQTERERLFDSEARGPVDPIDRFRGSIERTSAKTDRSNDFLHRSRAAVQRGVDRMDRLRLETGRPAEPEQADHDAATSPPS
jgi:hypothetical protein